MGMLGIPERVVPGLARSRGAADAAVGRQICHCCLLCLLLGLIPLCRVRHRLGTAVPPLEPGLDIPACCSTVEACRAGGRSPLLGAHAAGDAGAGAGHRPVVLSGVMEAQQPLGLLLFWPTVALRVLWSSSAVLCAHCGDAAAPPPRPLHPDHGFKGRAGWRPLQPLPSTSSPHRFLSARATRGPGGAGVVGTVLPTPGAGNHT